jgi:adenine-specific DNA-methyltransferase
LNYIGSKHSLLGFLESVYREVADGDETSFCDLFAGTGAVGRHFKSLGLRVLANDLQYYAYVLNRAYLELNAPPAFVRILPHLRRTSSASPGLPGLGLTDDSAGTVEAVLAAVNALPPREGFLAVQYAPPGPRRFFTTENAGRADAIRQAAEEWRRDALLTPDEYFYLLCSLLEALDAVANTASVYGAYLKRFKSTALKPLTLRPLRLVNHVSGCRAHHADANALIEQIECDVLYLDPPYNHRQYGANYHLLETVARYDEPAVTGVAGLPDYARSRYCRRREVAAAFEHLVRAARCRHILVSYNDEGLLSLDEIRRILSLRGEPRTFTQRYSRYKADNGREYSRDATLEYVHYVRTGG